MRRPLKRASAQAPKNASARGSEPVDGSAIDRSSVGGSASARRTREALLLWIIRPRIAV
jgi:hypothetical protein